MKHTAFLIKYAEIGVKGKNRYVFEDALVSQLNKAVKRVCEKGTCYKMPGRIYVEIPEEADEDEVVEAIGKVFGVMWICPVLKVEDKGFDDLKEKVVAFVRDEFGQDNTLTFKVEARRARKDYPKISREINEDLGEAILDAFPGMRVDVHKPDFELSVEVRERFIAVYAKQIKGPGGMPLGTSGKAMLLLSGGIDSPVAGYMMAKRGVTIDAVYFHAPPYTSERAKQKVVDLAKEISVYTGPIRLYVVNFTEVQLYLYEHGRHDELTILMRRYMMKIAEELAKKEHCLGLVTGESIGQVASQTMASLICTDDAAMMPVYRPLIALDKQEIVEISEKIGTFETSTLPYEDCCTIFVAKHPVTKPSLKGIRIAEYKLSEGITPLVEQALSSVEVIEVE